jgi:tripeptidyl-peptidase-1
MRAQFIFQIIVTLAVTVIATPLAASSKHIIHEARSAPPSAWTKKGRVHKEARLPVRVGLSQQNLHLAEEYLNQVSHPSSPDYGKHWSPEKIADTFSPSKETIQTVKTWLHDSGIDASRVKLSKSLGWLKFDATTAELERLLKTEYHRYEHESGSMHVACEKYSVPEHIRPHIDIITPTVHFDQKLGRERKNNKAPLPEKLDRVMNKRQIASGQRLGSATDGSNPKQGVTITNALVSEETCDTMITPACLRALYNVPEGDTATKNNTIGIVEYTPQAFLQNDLDMFFSSFATKVTKKNRTPETKLIDGAIVQTQNQSFGLNGESGLDLEYAMALVYPQRATLFQVGDTVEGASFNNFLDAIDGSYCSFEGGDDKNSDGIYPDTMAGGSKGAADCGTYASTKVISTSYGSNEADLTAAYEQRQCAEYMKLGLQGVSVLYSSGDNGVAGNSAQCIDPATNTYNDGKSGTFNPSFPGTCPYVTSVGATQVSNGSTVNDPETASETVIFSGGGFSNVFSMPDYQASAVKEYYANHKPKYTAQQYNNSQIVRGYPDVSANGVNYVVAVDGEFSLIFGTSASCPTFASLITLINEKRLAAGKSTVGFLNPTLYSNTDVLTDITSGTNQGCGTKGFTAVKGWDPVTGLGTPNYPKMLDLFMSLP